MIKNAMKGRERFITALENKKPDRMPCQVHSWMEYYLNTYLNGMDQYRAYEYFDMDPVIYTVPNYKYDDKDLANWRVEKKDTGMDQGNKTWVETFHTPKGDLRQTCASNEYTWWIIEKPIKHEKDFDIWNEFVPVPVDVDWAPVIQAKDRIGDSGIVRGPFFDFGQGSPWQSFETLFGMEKIIMTAMDKPDWIEHVMKSMLDKKLRVIEAAGKIEFDLVETGGGAGSSTVISPAMHEQFCLPYDIIQLRALHDAGTKVVYHLCGGLMPLLDLVVKNGADALETMTPPGMGGDCDLAGAQRQAGDKLAFIGGFDQNEGFESGTPEKVRQMVKDLFACCPEGGYICSPSDHFFFGDPENVRAFADTAKECYYD